MHMNRTAVRRSVQDQRVIPKQLLSQARQALKFRLKQQEDESLVCPMGPPSIMQACPTCIPRHQHDRFLELMEKEGLIVKHPYGGWMHPRFKAALTPFVQEVRKHMIEQLEGS